MTTHDTLFSPIGAFSSANRAVLSTLTLIICAFVILVITEGLGLTYFGVFPAVGDAFASIINGITNFFAPAPAFVPTGEMIEVAN